MVHHPKALFHALAHQLRVPAVRWTLFAVFLAVLFTTYTLAGDTWVRGGFRDDWLLCVEFIHEGTLYGGQPFCHHAPVFLYLLTFLKQSFGDSALVPITTCLNLILNVFIVIMLSQMLQRDTGKPHMLLTALFYLFVPFSYALTNTLIVVAAALAVWGIWMLYYSAHRYHVLFAGILFAFSIYTHPAILFALFAALVHYFLAQQPIFTRERPYLSPTAIRDALMLAVPVLLMGVGFLLRYPKFFHYTFLIATKLDPQPFSATLFALTLGLIPNLSYFNLTAILVPIASLYAFRNYRDVHSAIAGFGFLIGLVMVGRNLLHYAQLTYIRYFFFALCIFCVVAVKLIVTPKHLFNRILLASVFILLLIVPHALVFSAEVLRADTRRLIEQPLRMLPIQSGTILVEDFSEHDVLRRFGDTFPGNPEQLDVVPTTRNYFIDPQNIPGFTYYHLVDNMSNWERYSEIAYGATYNEIYAKFLSGSYSLILMGPPHWAMLNTIIQTALQAYPDIAKNYCRMQVPYVQYFDRSPSTKTTLVWFLDHAQCQEFATQMDAYYQAHWQEICERSPYLLSIIRDAQRADGREPNPTPCDNTGIDVVDFHFHVATTVDGFRT